MVVAKDILKICRRYSCSDLYIGTGIPQDKLANAMKGLPIPAAETVLALINSNLFKSCKNSFAIGMHGFYWHTNTTRRVTWEEFLEMGPMKLSFGEIVFKPGFACSLAGSGMKPKALIALLEDIRSYFRARSDIGPPVVNPEPVSYLESSYIRTPSRGEFAGSTIDLEGIRRICENYSNASYYVEELIPAKKLQAARENYSIPADEEVFALIDATIFGSAKNGLAICSGGLYWNNDWTTVSRKTSVLWDIFRDATIKVKGKWELEIGHGRLFGMSGSNMKNEELCRLLTEIQSFLTSPQTEANAMLPEWHLEANGQRFGPYDRRTVAWLAESRQIDVGGTLIWKKGRDEWSPLLDEEIFAGLAVPTSASPPPLSVSGNSDINPLFEELETSQGEPEALGKVDINTAPLIELVGLPGMTAIKAKKIIQERERRGSIGSLEELGVLLAFKPHVVETLRPLVSFSSLPIEVKEGRRIVDF
ncbi:hypothetical protein A8F94_08305 [Bacillus sp. FJAT-27225]|uniref:helix-hairpin-helix domain-containing protein n=1 Tax=Bacillus sp. FJAT-27225 TaxID=1743144 RepID=UPI00080C2D13|nr:helix-hairpin-helix domain-containing protein [Bacillus sp. FJAT-27225]OCA87833.1 hypothetical protein A8F94_08305 [Bacillus sp. FJAT-27225]